MMTDGGDTQPSGERRGSRWTLQIRRTSIRPEPIVVAGYWDARHANERENKKTTKEKKWSMLKRRR